MNGVRYLLPLLLLLLIGGGAWFLWPRTWVEQEGPARVIDAGTLEIAGTRYRLYGIVAPGPDQQCVDPQGRTWACGQQAMRALRTLVSGTPVLCRPHPGAGDRADCFFSGQSLAERLVGDGWALACRSGGPDYTTAENTARFLASGLWRGGFQPPRSTNGCAG